MRKNLFFILCMFLIVLSMAQAVYLEAVTNLNATGSNSVITITSINVTADRVLVESDSIALFNVSYQNGELVVNFSSDSVLNWSTPNAIIDSSAFPYLSSSSSVSKSIASNLTDTINASVTVTHPNCSILGNITYLSHSGTYTQQWLGGDFSCVGNDVTLSIIGIEPASSSNVLYFNVQPSTTTPVDVVQPEDTGTFWAWLWATVLGWFVDEEDASPTTVTLGSESDTSAVDCTLNDSLGIECSTVANQSGENLVNVSFTDSGGLSTSATGNVTITAVNDPPWMNGSGLGNSSDSEDFAVTLDDLIPVTDFNANFSDVEEGGAPTSITMIYQSNSSTSCYLDGSDNLDCDSVANASGIDYYTFELNDSGNSAFRLDWQITIASVDDVPWWDLISNSTYSVNEDSNSNLSAQANGRWQDYFRDVELDKAPASGSIIETNDSTIMNCSILSGDLVCDSLNNASGSISVWLRADDGTWLINQRFEVGIVAVDDTPWTDSLGDVVILEDNGTFSPFTYDEIYGSFKDVENSSVINIALNSQSNASLVNCSFINGSTSGGGDFWSSSLTYLSYDEFDDASINLSHFAFYDAAVEIPPNIYVAEASGLLTAASGGAGLFRMSTNDTDAGLGAGGNIKGVNGSFAFRQNADSDGNNVAIVISIGRGYETYKSYNESGFPIWIIEGAGNNTVWYNLSWFWTGADEVSYYYNNGTSGNVLQSIQTGMTESAYYLGFDHQPNGGAPSRYDIDWIRTQIADIGTNTSMSCVTSINASGTNLVNMSFFDDMGFETSGSFSVIVTAVNDAPWIDQLGNITMDEDNGTSTVYTGSEINASFRDVEDDQITYSFSIISQSNSSVVDCSAGNGLVCVSGVNISGNNTIAFEMNDSGNSAVRETITVFVTELNDPPWLNGSGLGNSSDSEDFAALGNIITVSDFNANFSDVEDNNNPSTITIIRQSNSSTSCYLDGSNNLDCDSVANASGIDRYTFELNDSWAGSLVLDWEINVSAVNDVPWQNGAGFSNISVSSGIDQIIAIGSTDFIANYTDVEDTELLQPYNVTVVSESDISITDCDIIAPSGYGSGWGGDLNCTVFGSAGSSDVVLNLTDSEGVGFLSSLKITVYLVDINVTVSPSDPCTTAYYTFDAFDESNLPADVNFSLRSQFFVYETFGSVLNNETADVSILNTDKVFVCVDGEASYYNLSAMVEYFGEVENESYSKRYYYLDDSRSILGDSLNYSLYLLPTNMSTLVQFTVRDRTEDVLKNAIIYVQKYIVENNTYELVAMGRTDDNGQDLINLNLYDTWYRFLVYNSEMGLVYLGERTRLNANTVTITISGASVTGSLTSFDGISTVLSFNSTGSNTFDLTFVDSTGSPRDVCLLVSKQTNRGLSVVCDFCDNSVSSSLSCAIDNSTASYIAQAYVEIDGIRRVINTAYATIRSVVDDDFTRSLWFDGLIGLVLLAGTFAFAFVWNPTAGLVAMFVAIAVAAVLGLVHLSFVPGVVALGIIVLYVAYKMRS